MFLVGGTVLFEELVSGGVSSLERHWVIHILVLLSKIAQAEQRQQ